MKYSIKINTCDKFTYPIIPNELDYEEEIDCKVALLKHLLIIWHGIIPFPASDYKIDFDTLKVDNLAHNGPKIMTAAQLMISKAMFAVEDDTSFDMFDGESSIKWEIVYK